MELKRRNSLVYGLLVAVWVLVAGWQIEEHVRVRKSARAALINRAKDKSDTLALVMRSQRRFGGVISKERMEAALNELIRPGELNAIALLNADGEVVASVGEPIDLQSEGVVRSGELWGDRTVTLMNLVNLGTNLTQDLQVTNLTIVVPRHELTNRPPPSASEAAPPPPFEPGTNLFAGRDAGDAINAPTRSPGRSRPRGDGDGRRPFGRPFWMSEDEYQSLIQRQGVHGFVLVFSTQSILATYSQDLWLRSIISVLASISVVGFALAWRNLVKSSDLQLRLVRTSELNTHLKEMNLAAAGLAHETRNPLNIIRGLAQMISRQKDAPPEVRERSREILDETDRVTAQLNEFINYSRPREVRRSAVPLGSVIGEVVRALNYDLEEKHIRLQVTENQPAIEADEQLLRQALFNLLLNATQAVDAGGEIEMAASRINASEAILEIRDNGPGVSPDKRTEIFKPYFTTHQKGTGLGLAVVQQIVLAHGWEIECVANEPRGAVFRISHLKLANGA
jgi:signal transduction histidine kinase